MNLRAHTIEFGYPNLLMSIGESKIPVFKLEDTRFVLPLNGVHKIFGYEGKSDHWLLNILQTISKFSKIPLEIIGAYENPIKAHFNAVAEKSEPIKVIETKVFIETCKIIIQAKENGWLGINIIRVSKTAQSILNHFENQAFDEFAAEACGFNTFKEAMKTEFIQYLLEQTNETAFLWIKTFPDSFFALLFKTHAGSWKDLKTKPEVCGKWMTEAVFSRFSPDLLADLRAHAPKRNYRRKQNSPQENAHPELKKTVADMIALMETAAWNWFIFLQLLNRTYPIQSEPIHNLKLEPKPPKTFSAFSNSLKKFT